MSWKQAEFELCFNHTQGKGVEPRKVRGYVNGIMGVCKRPDWPYRVWQVIHLPTGVMAQNDLRTLAEAKTCAEEYAVCLPASGEFGDTKLKQLDKAAMKECRRIREAWNDRAWFPASWR